MVKFKNAKKTLEFDILTKTKGFIAEATEEGNTTREYFQFKEIHQIILHPNIGIEIVGYNDSRRVFYNDEEGEALIMFNLITGTMNTWMNTNLN